MGRTAERLIRDEFQHMEQLGTGTEGTNGSGHTASDVPPSDVYRWRLLTDEEIEQEPPRASLISGIIDVEGLVAIAAPPASYKTTLATDGALSIATGTRFHGRNVRRGLVVFVAAEGRGGLGPRFRAWKRTHGWQGPSGVYVLPHAVNVMQGAEVGAFLQCVESLPTPPVMVVFDTFARCMTGGEENSARDVGLWIAGADRIRAELQTAVVVLHHTPKSGNDLRGSGALRGAADTIILLEREDDVLTVTCDKAKDAAPFAPLKFGLRTVFLDDGQSAQVLTDDLPVSDAPPDPTKPLPATRQKALDALRDLDHGDGTTAAEWQRATPLKDRTFHRAIKDLVRRGKVEKNGSGRGARYHARASE